MNLEIPYACCPRCSGTGRELDHQLIGSRLREMRQERGITAHHVAQEMGLSPAMICEMESGERRWTLDRIEEYQRILKL